MHDSADVEGQIALLSSLGYVGLRANANELRFPKKEEESSRIETRKKWAPRRSSSVLSGPEGVDRKQTEELGKQSWKHVMLFFATTPTTCAVAAQFES